MLHLETVAMAPKKQKNKADLVFEFVRKLPVMKIAVSDNRESRPKVVKTQFLSPLCAREAPNLTRRLSKWSELMIKRN